MSRTWLPFVGCLALSCGGAGATPAGPIEVGVDPSAEARAVADGLMRGGYSEERRVESAHFIALSFRSRDRQRTAVRIVTSRGVAFATDASLSPGGDGLEVSLLEVPENLARDTHEALISSRDRRVERTCIRVVTVTSDDSAHEIPVAMSDVDASACIEQIADVNGDGTLDAIAVVRARELARHDVPTVRVPLRAGASGFELPDDRAFASYFESEETRRREALSSLPSDVEVAYVRSVELALLARVRGLGRDLQVRALDEGMRGLVLTPQVAESLVHVRAFFARAPTR